MATRPEPIRIPPLTPPSNPAHGATIIFLHGLGDDGAGFANIAEQFQGAEKLPYASWMFPTAPENRCVRLFCSFLINRHYMHASLGRQQRED